MPQIQGYNLGSPTGQINEVTVTSSGTKHYLDINLQATDMISVSGIVLGSVAITTDPVPVLGSVNVDNTIRQVSAGSVIITNVPSVNQGTDPWIVLGSVAITTNPVPISGTVVSAPLPAADRVNQFNRVSPGATGSTLVSQTVGAGSIIDISSWHFSTESAIALVELQVDGTAVDAIRFANSASTNRESPGYGTSAIQATGTQVIRIQFIEGDTGKEFITGFIGDEKQP